MPPLPSRKRVILGIACVIVGIAWSASVLVFAVTDPPREYATVRTYLSQLCVSDQEVTVRRQEHGELTGCSGMWFEATVELVMSVPKHRPPGTDRLPEAGPEKAVVVTLIGDSYFWQTGAMGPRQSSYFTEEFLPRETLDRILPVLAAEIADQAGEETAGAVRRGGITVSSLPKIQNRGRWPIFAGAGLFGLGTAILRWRGPGVSEEEVEHG
jgi:hypothetical protein